MIEALIVVVGVGVLMVCGLVVDWDRRRGEAKQQRRDEEVMHRWQ